MNKLLRRSNKVAFYSIKNGDVTEYHRMKGFTDFTVSKNPSEYSRKYVDETFEQSDVVGYSPSVSFSFDYIKDNKIHNDIANISKNELVGDDAVREILMIDFSSDEKNPTAIKREFSVIVENEGSGMEGYIVKGSFKVKGEKIFGKASSADSFVTAVFAEE